MEKVKNCGCMGDCYLTEAVCIEECREEGLVYFPALIRCKKVSKIRYSKPEKTAEKAVKVAQEVADGLRPY